MEKIKEIKKVIEKLNVSMKNIVNVNCVKILNKEIKENHVNVHQEEHRVTKEEKKILTNITKKVSEKIV